MFSSNIQIDIDNIDLACVDLDSNIVNNLDSSFVIDLDNNVNTIDNSIGNNSSNTLTDHGDTIQISSCFSSNEEVPSKKICE